MSAIWETLSPPWRGCHEEAWAAYCAGSVPIADADGQIAARGRNHIDETEGGGRLAKSRAVAWHRRVHE